MLDLGRHRVVLDFGYSHIFGEEGSAPEATYHTLCSFLGTAEAFGFIVREYGSSIELTIQWDWRLHVDFKADDEICIAGKSGTLHRIEAGVFVHIGKRTKQADGRHTLPVTFVRRNE